MSERFSVRPGSRGLVLSCAGRAVVAPDLPGAREALLAEATLVRGVGDYERVGYGVFREIVRAQTLAIRELVAAYRAFPCADYLVCRSWGIFAGVFVVVCLSTRVGVAGELVRRVACWVFVVFVEVVS